MTRVKIVHALGWYFPDSVGGTESYVARLSKLQTERGLDVRVAAPSAEAIGSALYTHDGVPVFRYPVPQVPTRAEAQGVVAVRGGKRMVDWVASERPALVHVHSLVTGLSLHELRGIRATGAALVVTNHLPNLGYHCLRGNLMRLGATPCDGVVTVRGCAACTLESRGASPRAAALLGATPAWIGRLAAPGLFGRVSTALRMPLYVERAQRRQAELYALVDRFVVLNDWALQCLVAAGAPSDKICLNRLGVDASHVLQVPLSPRDDRPLTFGYVGRFDPDKGVLPLVDAFMALGRRAPARLRLIGPRRAETEETLRRVFDRTQGDPRVTVEPPLPVDGVAACLRELDVLCCPSTGFENGPTIALEALAAGTPVIGTRVGGLPEIVRDGVDGALVPPFDVSALTAVLQSVLDDPAVVGRWRQAIRSVRTMTDVADDYDRLYAEVLDAGRCVDSTIH
jgi:glycosyltransferase involved in cell wall biosynthesis